MTPVVAEDSPSARTATPSLDSGSSSQFSTTSVTSRAAGSAAGLVA
ncbi:hypothetical protein AB0N14_32855 [Streptomyces sp. NPDC051104]